MVLESLRHTWPASSHLSARQTGKDDQSRRCQSRHTRAPWGANACCSKSAEKMKTTHPSTQVLLGPHASCRHNDRTTGARCVLRCRRIDGRQRNIGQGPYNHSQAKGPSLAACTEPACMDRLAAGRFWHATKLEMTCWTSSRQAARCAAGMARQSGPRMAAVPQRR